jgi:hypothetical protein
MTEIPEGVIGNLGDLLGGTAAAGVLGLGAKTGGFG